MSTSVNSDTSEVSISHMCQAYSSIQGGCEVIPYISRYISLLDVPDQKSALCQADNTRSERLIVVTRISEFMQSKI